VKVILPGIGMKRTLARVGMGAGLRRTGFEVIESYRQQIELKHT